METDEEAHEDAWEFSEKDMDDMPPQEVTTHTHSFTWGLGLQGCGMQG